MSHFTRIKTQMAVKEYLLHALKELGHAYVEGTAEIRGFGGRKMQVEIRLPRPAGYDIGFRKEDAGYECVADWWGVRGTSQEQFLQPLTRRYAYHAARARLEEKGFSLVSEETSADGRVHLVLRRVA